MTDNTLLFQLHSVPVPNRAVTPSGPGQLSVPLRHPFWARWLRLVLPLSKEKKIELDKRGNEILALCDGQRTVEELIDLHKDRWHLSFFESRAMILQFLRQLLRHNLIVIIPGDAIDRPTEQHLK
ncbi:MAG: hypothetical protein PCFJNLEI_00582 [Verrucomicrobiae bacterium]|nr:hypothetical protein [Verrucomicrobiae bacterium]